MDISKQTSYITSCKMCIILMVKKFDKLIDLLLTCVAQEFDFKHYESEIFQQFTKPKNPVSNKYPNTYAVSNSKFSILTIATHKKAEQQIY